MKTDIEKFLELIYVDGSELDYPDEFIDLRTGELITLDNLQEFINRRNAGDS